jgi:hypothetical protein
MSSFEALINNPNCAENISTGISEQSHVSETPTPVMSENFKIVKVRKPYGTIVTAKRRVPASSNHEATKQTPATSKPGTTPQASSKKLAEATSNTSNPTVLFNTSILKATSVASVARPSKIVTHSRSLY